MYVCVFWDAFVFARVAFGFCVTFVFWFIIQDRYFLLLLKHAFAKKLLKINIIFIDGCLVSAMV